ncbi:MAG: hypothetical protein ACTSRR_09315 [Candidatus Heimdallarchaeaceae archaeon]
MNFEIGFSFNSNLSLDELDFILKDLDSEKQNAIKEILAKIINDVLAETFTKQLRKHNFKPRKIQTLTTTIPFEYVPDKQTVITEIINGNSIIIAIDIAGNWIVKIMD